MSSQRKLVVVVDNSNIFIEGQKFSARMKNGCKKMQNGREAQDASWRIDFGGLLFQVSNGRLVQHAILVGSRPPKNDSVWKSAEDSGFDVTVHDRNFVNVEKAVDTELVAQATEIICTTSEIMDLAILSGDADFVPLVSVAHRRGWSVEMWAFSNAFSQTGNLASAVNEIRLLDNVFARIGSYSSPRP